MLKYLIIQLDDSSVSFCHYPDCKSRSNLLPVETLKEAVVWAMKENLTLQFIYPDHELPDEYRSVIAKTFHADIVSSKCEDEELRAKADVVVFESPDSMDSFPFNREQSYVLRTTFAELFESCERLGSLLPKVNRLNIVVTDIISLGKEDEKKYEIFLDSLSDKVVDEYKAGHEIQINVLTDRILLDRMNNCNAGDETITLCPDGRFYVCPAFYSDDQLNFSIGNPGDGLDIRNAQLYKISHAPICGICDAYQCRRCIWLNKTMTLEVNTPSHEQCLASHIERNASRRLLAKLRELGISLPGKEIVEINYLDPFDKIISNR